MSIRVSCSPAIRHAFETQVLGYIPLALLIRNTLQSAGAAALLAWGQEHPRMLFFSSHTY
jgi:hypothetical protein